MNHHYRYLLEEEEIDEFSPELLDPDMIIFKPVEEDEEDIEHRV